MGAIAAIFSGPYAMLARMAVMAIACAAIWAHGWFKGNEHGTEKLTDYIGAQAKETIRVAAARVQVVVQTETKWRTKIVEVLTKGDTIEKEVKVYVTSADDAGCIVPVGFVREHTAAWSNTPAGPAAESDRGPSGVPLSEVAAAEAANATACHTYKAQRDGVIEFYRRQQKVK